VTPFYDIDIAGPVESRAGKTKLYTLRPNDNLYISIVSSNADVNRLYNPAQSGAPNTANNNYEGDANKYLYGYQVDDDGNVEIPLLGTINVSNKTLEEAEGLIHDKAKAQYKEVTTKVRLLNYKVTVMGEVKNPGVYYNFDGDFTILSALGRAGGLTEFALIEEILILRPDAGKQTAIIVDLSSKSTLVSDGFYLFPNDVVIIKPAKNKNRQLRGPVLTWMIPAISAVLLFLNYTK
jgi:polysaccharide export outer membrane protein